MLRPRSVRAHDQVLDAALKPFAARGIDATIMDALAAEVLARVHGFDEPAPVFDSGNVRADLVSRA